MVRLRIAAEHPAGVDVFALIEKIAFVETDLVRLGCRVRIKGSKADLNVKHLFYGEAKRTERKDKPVDRRSKAAPVREATFDTELCFRCPSAAADATNLGGKHFFDSLRTLKRRGFPSRDKEETSNLCCASLSMWVPNLGLMILDRRSTDRNWPLEETRKRRLKKKRNVILPRPTLAVSVAAE